MFSAFQTFGRLGLPALAWLGNRWNNSPSFPPWTPVNLQTGGNWATMQSQLQNMIATASGPCGDGVTTPNGTYPGTYAFVGGVLLPDGRVFCVPSSSTSASIAGADRGPIDFNMTTSPFFNKF